MRVGRFARVLLPRTITAQFALVLVAALLVANLIALILVEHERTRVARDVRRTAQIERLAGLAAAMIDVAPALRPNIAANSSTPFLQLRVAAAPEAAANAPERLARDLADELNEELSGLGITLPARVAVDPDGRPWPRPRADEEEHSGGRRSGRHGGDHDDDRPRRHGPHRRDPDAPPDVVASIPFGDGTWLNARLPGPGRLPPIGGRTVLMTLGLSLITVVGAGILFTRRLTRPIRSLAAAAERAGFGDRSATAEVGGPAEVRRAAEAFNAMQSRIAQFDDERARTIAAVGHDLRTPITSLRIRAEMLEVDEEREAMVRTLDEMRVMADGLLDFGRSEAEPEPCQRVDLAAVLVGLSDDAVTYEGPEHLMLDGRPVALTRAFANLVENARRYAGGGHIDLSEDGTGVAVTITDSGPGIPVDRHAEMFEPFKRLESSRNAETGGAGLGLSIARTLIRAHGGDVTLESPVSGGLTVRVTLPRGVVR